MRVSLEEPNVHASPFAVEYHAEGAHLSKRRRQVLEARLRKLSRGHRDMTGASLAVEPATGDQRREEYRVRLVVYCRPHNVAAVGKANSVSEALGEALEAVERQIRSQRERVRERSRARR